MNEKLIYKKETTILHFLIPGEDKYLYLEYVDYEIDGHNGKLVGLNYCHGTDYLEEGTTGDCYKNFLEDFAKNDEKLLKDFLTFAFCFNISHSNTEKICDFINYRNRLEFDLSEINNVKKDDE